MSQVTLERIIDEMATLTVDEKRQLRGVIDEALRTDEQVRCRAVVLDVKGKYAHIGLSSEDFASNKQSELDLEDVRREP